MLTDVWVDPVQGSDANDGSTRGRALQTVESAWRRIPVAQSLTGTGYRILLARGTYPAENLPNYWESRYGTFMFPVLIQAADGPGTVNLPAMNVFDCRYIYLLGFSISAPGGDVLHFDRCDHVLVRQTEVRGLGTIADYNIPQETLKVNQSQFLYLEDNDISGAWDNAVDFVAVQYGHIVGNRIHRSGDWCIYLKGGSAYFRIEGNEIFDGGTGGFTAGQGTGFEFMNVPWVHYEAYDLKFINNVVHDTDGAGMGVNGGYNILFAYNTLYRVGRRSHLIEAGFGARGCDGDVARCAEYLRAGGWGIARQGQEEPIPNRNVFVYNNIVLNPPGFQSESQHFTIPGPALPDNGTNIASPARTDVNLQIRGNVIWNGPPSMALGIEDPDQGCQAVNLTCNAVQLLAENSINTLLPQLRDPAGGDFHPVPAGNVFSAKSYSIPDFSGGDRAQPPLAPEGNRMNGVSRDRDGIARNPSAPPGAYSSSGRP